MPRRTSSRLRGGAVGSGAGASDDGGGVDGGQLGDPGLPPSPGKRKACSPVEEELLLAGCLVPAAVRCMPFQSPKKKALGGGIGDRLIAPLDKENELLLVAGGGGNSSPGVPAQVFEDGGGQAFGSSGLVGGSFRRSAFSAFSHHASSKGGSAHRVGARRRSREENGVPVSSTAAAAARAASSSTSPRVLDLVKSSPLPFLLAPAGMASSPDLRGCRTSSSRRPRRGALARSSRDSSSSNGSSSSPALTPVSVARCSGAHAGAVAGTEDLALTPPRRCSLTGAGCAAGGRRAATATAAASAASAASPESKNSGGGGPAGACRRVIGGGGRGGDTMSDPDRSPHRSPIHRLTESLQKWDPGSRYTSPAGALGDDGGGGSVGGDGGGAGKMGGGVKEVGASWNGQELRRTLEKERVRRGRRRRHSITSAAEVMYPQGNFGDHSPISPASSAASVNLCGFDAGTPVSAGRTWRSSPSRGEGGGDGGGEGGRSAAVQGSEDRFGIVRMEGSWSEDETGPSGTAMRLAFSPGRITDARTPAGGRGGGGPPAEATTAAGAARAAAEAATDAATPSTARWQHAFSPVKGQRRTRSSGDAGSGSSALSLGSPVLSKSRDSSGIASAARGAAGGGTFAASPEQHSLLSVRDLMDQGTDDEADGGEAGGAALVRRRRRRPRPERALRTLEMPDVTDVTVLDGESAAAEEGATLEGEATAPINASGIANEIKLPNPLVSPAFTGRGLASSGFGSGCTTACPRWDRETGGLLDSSSICPHDTPAGSRDDSWIRERSKGKGRDRAQSTSGFGTSTGGEEVGQDVTGGLSSESSAISLGISSLSGADTSSASDASTSFVKSRPIPDQAAFSSSRASKAGVGAPQSPPDGGGGSGGGPAAGPGPLCVTPRKSMMRCPPTPQRTPTWDGLEDSLLLEGAGSGGRCGSSGMSSRHSLWRSKLLASSDDSLPKVDMGVDGGLARASGGRERSASLLDAAGEEGVRGGGRGGGSDAIGGGGDDGSYGGGRGGTGGRRGRGRGGRDRFVGGNSGNDGGGSGCGDAEPASGSAAGGGAAGDGTLGFKHDFVQMGPIGEGGFSVVWKVRARRTGRLYAIKRSKREFRGRRDRDRCLWEAKALKRLAEHPGVLRFERAWQEEGHFCLQTELCELGTLKDFLERLPSRKEIPEAAVWQVLHDVGQALRHVHASGLVHLDVKPANLLIGDEGVLKLADFGMATAYGEGVDGVGDGQEGDTLYMAKELLSSVERLPSADMFSLGLTVYEIATRTELPGDGEDWHAMRDGRASALAPSRSQDLSKVLRQLMRPEPGQRPTADALCRQPPVAAFATGNGGAGGETAARHDRDDYVVSQARLRRAAEAAAMDHPSSGLRTPTGDMSARYIFQQTG